MLLRRALPPIQIAASQAVSIQLKSGIRGGPPVTARVFRRRLLSTLNATSPLFRLGPLKCLWAPIGSARAGRAPGFN